METYQLDRLDNLLKILQNVEGQETEILTEMTAAGKKLNQYSRFDQWNLDYDANGNLSTRGTQGFTYDYRNRMISAAESGTTVNFNYDALGRRMEKTGPQGTTRYYYAGDQVIEERDGSGQVTKQYLYGNGIDEVLRLDLYSGATATPYYFHTNQIGSTTAITDSDGNVIERVSYDTYGRPYFSDVEGNSLNSSSIGNTTLFQGREYDCETGLYHYRARAYDPIMGRFLQTDPLGYVDSMNLYQAFNMNPVNYVDPLGEFVQKLTNFNVMLGRDQRGNYGVTTEYQFKLEFGVFENAVANLIGKELVGALLGRYAISILNKLGASKDILKLVNAAKSGYSKANIVYEVLSLLFGFDFPSAGPELPFKDIDDLFSVDKWTEFLKIALKEEKESDQIVKQAYREWGKKPGDSYYLTLEELKDFYGFMHQGGYLSEPSMRNYNWDALIMNSLSDFERAFEKNDSVFYDVFRVGGFSMLKIGNKHFGRNEFSSLLNQYSRMLNISGNEKDMFDYMFRIDLRGGRYRFR